MTAGGAQTDRDKMREEILKLNGERDEKLKKIFTADQFKKFTPRDLCCHKPRTPSIYI